MAQGDNGNKYLTDLAGEQFQQIKEHLNNSGSSNYGLEALLKALSSLDVKHKYKLGPDDCKRILNNKCPTSALILKLGGKGMTVDEFASYAVIIEDAVLMRIFNCRVDLCITQHPLPQVVCQEGGCLSLSVEATGFPLPTFQWYKDGHLINGAVQRNLQWRDVKFEATGEYQCAVFQGHYTYEISRPSKVSIKRAPELQVKRQPRNTPVSLDTDALLSCNVWGPNDMQYQWFKGSCALQDGPRIKGSRSNELSLYHVNRNDLGTYHCEINWRDQCVHTNKAALQIAELLQRSEKEYSATDKVALLIGCEDYRGEEILLAPRNDVQTLASIFKSLNFKVVSLLNLTRGEIIAAVNEFLALVGPGVYCVFYFCGHGFEDRGQVYLVPVDAPQGFTASPHNCISSDRIYDTLQVKDPKLLCMILDVCRKPPEFDTVDRTMESKKAVHRGNTIKVYGTSYGLSAYEKCGHGIVVNNLKDILSLPNSIEITFMKFREAIAHDPKLKKNEHKKQIPQVITELLEPMRSLADPIVYTGHTALFERRQLAWEMAHGVPETRDVSVAFQGFVVKVRLEFQQVCSNILNIFTSVIDKGPAENCSVWVCGIPPDIGGKPENKMIFSDDGNCLFRSKIELCNIHRLKRDMNINIEVQCRGPDVSKTEKVTGLGLPLAAVLRLWEEATPDFTRPRMPQESIDTEMEKLQIKY